MKTITGVEYFFGGKKLKCDVRIYSRGGLKSPEQHVVRINGRWVTPFEQRVRDINPSINGLFALTYPPLVFQQLWSDSFIKYIPADPDWVSSAVPIPFRVGGA